jgi:chemotaxis response regulator CheB
MTGVRLRALVVDDEPLARRTLCELLERERDVELVGCLRRRAQRDRGGAGRPA